MSVSTRSGTSSEKPSARARSSPAGAGGRAPWLAAAWLGVLWGLPAASQSPVPKEDLTRLGLEALMDIEVTSVSRREQKVSDTASAIYVITQEDVRRSGASSIPEALRMAPGVHVARIDANKWAISIRGFTNRFSDKLLVMIDGRSVYTPAFSGVYWEAQDTLLEDIERIEVVRGPGALMWGSNAVNGVINVITKHASDTHGLLATTGGGNEEGGFGGLRYGARAGPNLHYRVYSKYFGRSSLVQESGERAADDWRALRGGFRLDWAQSGSDSFALSGGSYESDAGGTVSVPSSRFPFQQQVDETAALSGSHVLGRWIHRGSERSQTHLQVYFDHYQRSEEILERQSVDTVDFDFHHRLKLTSRSLLSWGLGYRAYHDEFINTRFVSLQPAETTRQLFNTFVQGEIELIDERLVLSMGSKFEHNSFTDWEIQPGASLLWDRTALDSVWLSVSRAVRIPTRINHDVRANLQGFPGPDGSMALIAVLGNPAFQSETLLAYDAGYRVRASKDVALDLAVFHNDYDRLQTAQPGLPFVDSSLPGRPLVFAHYQGNSREGEAYGAEVASTWTATRQWKLNLGYSWLQLRFRDAVPTIVPADVEAGRAPAHQLHARSYLDFPGGLQWDAAYYFVDSLQGTGAPRYHRLDTRVGWQANRWLELSAGVQNLLDNQHPEALPVGFERPTEVGRSAYAKTTWRF